MNKTRLMAAAGFLALVLAFGVGVWAGATGEGAHAQTTTVTLTPQDQQPNGVDMSQFWQAWNILQNNFVQTHSSTTPTTQQMLYGAIEGLTSSYGDPYTVFLPPSDATTFNQDVSGSFGGVGMEMSDNAQGQIVVTKPLPGSPAAAAGILPGDVVTSIDATSTEGMDSDAAVQLIRGPVGTTVKLGILHAGATQPVTISIVRQTINEPIVDTSNSGGIFTISLYEFSENSADLFRDALRQYEQSGDTKLILDLRGNPGGYLDQAVDMASYFLPVGDTVVTEDMEGHGDNVVHTSLGYNVFANKKLSMAILVDQNTASAAEILSGALQQHGVAKLIGTRTFGKGSVQQLVDMGGGAELKITIARWLTPNGSWISETGLKPDISVPNSTSTTAAQIDTSQDPTYQAAAAWLATQ